MAFIDDRFSAQWLFGAPAQVGLEFAMGSTVFQGYFHVPGVIGRVFVVRTNIKRDF